MVVPYIGTWIETLIPGVGGFLGGVVPYIGTWIETNLDIIWGTYDKVVPYIGTWIETNSLCDRINYNVSYLI